MSDLFEKTNEPAKQTAVLEKFCDAYQDDPNAPQVYIKLGMLYRNLGLYKLAFARFYSVLNFSLRIDQNKIDTYRKLSIRAQMEIADTHFIMGSYTDAIKFYSKLRLLSLEPEENAHALFQTAYCHYLLKEYSQSIPVFETFVHDFPQNERVAEAMYLLADAFSRTDKHAEATQTVFALLKRQHEATLKEKDEKEWIRWQRKAGNELANNLFEQSDYAGALAMYQAMLPLGSEPEWCWPVMYQAGLCYEHLALMDKAKQSYNQIIDWPDKAGARTDALKNASLAETYDMAKWRLKNIDWRSDTGEKLENLLDKSR
jgi:tetratricopeptide (TPR) repeat protein